MASRCSGVARGMGRAWLVTRMSTWFTFRLISPEAGKASGEDLVQFFQFEFKLGNHSTTPRRFHLHFRVQAFRPQVTKIGKELGQLGSVCVWHF